MSTKNRVAVESSRRRTLERSRVQARQRSRAQREEMTNRILVGVMVLVCVVMVAPVLWLFLSSLKTMGQMSSWPVVWIPPDPQWTNYVHALTDIPFVAMTMNSLFLATMSAVLTTFSSALTAYGFARLKGVGKGFLFAVLIALMMMPPIITLIPTYLMFARVNLVGTYWPWVFWGLAGSAGTIFLFRQHFTTLPSELEDAAILDGASRFRIFWQIFLPLSKPLLVTSFVLTFVWVWGDYITPMLLLRSDNTTLAVGLAAGYPNPVNLGQPMYTAAGAVLYVIPVIALFLMVQRAYVQGVTASSVKG